MKPEQVAEFGGADGPVLQDGVEDAVAGALFGVGRRERCGSLRGHGCHASAATPRRGAPRPAEGSRQ